MNINQKFLVWCARRCVHLWNPPRSVLDWLDDPENVEKAAKAVDETWAIIDGEGVAWRNDIQDQWVAPDRTVWAAYAAAGTVAYAAAVDHATPEWAIEALCMTIDELKHEFVLTLTDEDLSTTDSEWIEYVTPEIFTRQH